MSIFGTLALIFVPGLVVTVLWSPILLIGRFRALFARLPPIRSTIVNYCLVSLALSIPFVVGTTIVFTTTSTEGADLSNTLLNMAVLLAATYGIVLPLAAGFGLPRLGIDWDPTGYGPGTWLLLVGAVLWYIVVFVVPLAFFAFVLALPTG